MSTRVNRQKTPGIARANQLEGTHSALALILGPATEYHLRVRAARRLLKQGPEVLPLFLNTLSKHPEITVPAWPRWPPQYEHCSRLLIHLGQRARLSLMGMLHHPELSAPAGPVLWTSLVEAAGLMPYQNYEELLCQGLEMPWEGTRYSAAMALAMRARRVTLQGTSVERLCMHIGAEEALPVRLTAAYTLLSCRKAAGLETLLQFLDAREEEEARKAAVYMFATELPFQITEAQREQLSLCLLQLLRDTNPDIAMHAAHALSKIAWPTLMMPLSQMLGEKEVPVQVAVLICMEEIARRDSMRDELQQSGLPTRILPLLRSETVEVRRQASYTLAACGGEYALAALGTILLRQDHPGRLEAIESLRLVRGALRPPTRIKILRWLLQLLNSTEEITQVTALDSLAYLLWQASTRGRKRSWYELGDELLSDGTITELLYHASAWVRQRAVELFRLLGQRVAEHPEVYQRLQQLLQYDEDSGVRASVAYTFGQLGTRQAVAALLRALIDVDRHVALTALNALEATSTPDDTIIVFALKELTRYGLKGDQDGEQLIQKAEEILKKWRRSLARAGKRKQEG